MPGASVVLRSHAKALVKHRFSFGSGHHESQHACKAGGPILKFDLRRETEQLRREPAWFYGRNAKTLVKHRFSFGSGSHESQHANALAPCEEHSIPPTTS